MGPDERHYRPGTEPATRPGEIDKAGFTSLLRNARAAMTDVNLDGAIHFVCMNWPHMDELCAVGEEVYSEPKNLVVCAKTNSGMGTFHGSQHELIFVYKFGPTKHLNTFGLGETGD